MLLLFLILIQTISAQDISTTSAQPASPSQDGPTEILTSPSKEPNKIDQYTKDYRFQRDIFNASYLIYTDKKQVHTRYGTIITQKEKQEATRVTMIARNTMLRTYLTALRVKLEEFQIQDPTPTEKLKIDLVKWEAWLDEQNTVVSSLITEDDFKSNAREFKTKYNQIQQVVETSLVWLQTNLQKSTQSKLQELNNQVQLQPLKTEASQLLSEIRVKQDLINQSLKQAQDASTSKQYGTDFSSFYPTAKKHLTKSRDYLSEILQNLEGILLRYL